MQDHAGADLMSIGQVCGTLQQPGRLGCCIGMLTVCCAPCFRALGPVGTLHAQPAESLKPMLTCGRIPFVICVCLSSPSTVPFPTVVS